MQEIKRKLAPTAFRSSRIFSKQLESFSTLRVTGNNVQRECYVCIGTTDIYSSVTIFLLEATSAREKRSLNAVEVP